MSAPPPVSLPAPISGRFDGPITVGEPGGSGHVSISAAPGSVAPHATVLVVNTTAEASLSLQISPAVSAICSQPTRTCVTADDIGGFAAVIQCRPGETLLLVVIDPDTGKELGSRRYATISGEEAGEEHETVAGTPAPEEPATGDGDDAEDYQIDRISIGFTTLMVGDQVTITSVSVYTMGEGAVKPYSTVLGTNETVAAPYQAAGPRRWYHAVAAFCLRQIERFAWSEALAGLFHPICYTDGRACAMADQWGQFKMQLVAVEGDEVTIAVIDPKTGKERFRLKQVLVPKGAGKQGSGGNGTGSGSSAAGGTSSGGAAQQEKKDDPAASPTSGSSSGAGAKIKGKP